MSLNTKHNLWRRIASGKFPGLSESEIDALSFKAANRWYNRFEDKETDTELIYLYDQYMLMKELSGI